MNISINRRDQVVKTMRWAARIFCVLLLVLWGAFFVEHLSWFLSQQNPPLFVWLLQSLHLILLLSFLIALRWEVAGSLLIVGSALLFFAQTAGANFLPFFAVTILPAALFLICHWTERTLLPPNLKGHII